MIERLPSVCDALGSVPRNRKKNYIGGSVLERKTDSHQGAYSVASDRTKSRVRDTNRLDLKKSDRTPLFRRLHHQAHT